MRILVLNWRCPKNPRAGGAESFTYHVMRRFVAAGDSVEWFSASFPGAPSHELLDGIQIVRNGTQSSVHLAAFRRYRGRVKSDFDAVIDQVNTIPFFAPLWAGVPTFMLIHQLAREVWWYESRFPASLIGYCLEPAYLRIYRKVPVFTVSASTEGDLKRLGFLDVQIVREGLEPIEPPSVTRASSPTFLYVGRLAPSKRVHEIIHAFKRFLEVVKVGQLQLVGIGPARYQNSLRRLVHRLDLERHVQFLGRLEQAEKHRRMAEAHGLLMASVREGWGLVVIEANACGTPAIVYDVQGLRDAVQDEVTGLVVTPTPNAMSAAMLRLWRDRSLQEALGNAAARWSKTFRFDETANSMRRQIAERTGQERELGTPLWS